MKRPALLALAIVPLVGIFIAARSAASWRPQTVSAAEFERVSAPPLDVTDGLKRAELTEQNRKLATLAKSKNWDFRGASRDGTRMLVQSPVSALAAIMDARDGSIITEMESYPGPHSNTARWSNVRFSPDNALVIYQQLGHTSELVFDARNGNSSWESGIVNNNSGASSLSRHLTFSATGRFIALTEWRDNPTQKRLTISKASFLSEHKSLPHSLSVTRYRFSRDDRYLLVEFKPGQFQQWRLR